MLKQKHGEEQSQAAVMAAPIPDPQVYSVASRGSFRPAFRHIYLTALACNALPLLITVPRLSYRSHLCI